MKEQMYNMHKEGEKDIQVNKSQLDQFETAGWERGRPVPREEPVEYKRHIHVPEPTVGSIRMVRGDEETLCDKSQVSALLAEGWKKHVRIPDTVDSTPELNEPTETKTGDEIGDDTSTAPTSPEGEPEVANNDGDEDDDDGRILAAVMGLDANNDEHWTASGKPSMAALEVSLGSDEVSRADVNRVAGDYNRKTARGE